MSGEERLPGGFAPGGVVKRGDTVVRPGGAWTPTVHRLLRHLEGCGIEAPAPVSFDGDREVLTFLPGAALLYPLPDWVWEERVTVAVARLLRRLHDCTATFEHRDGDVWQWPVREPREVVCHNDVAAYNVVFRDGEVAALIDFDMSAPGPRIQDVAYAVYRFVPITAPTNPDTPAFPPERQLARLRAFCDAYGGLDPAGVLAAVVARLADASERITTGAAAGDAREAEPFRLGHHLLYDADRAWAEAL